VIVRDADVAAEARTFEMLARAMEKLTPRVELERPGRLSFPTRGPSRYFGGDEALVVQVRAATASAGLCEVPARVGIAGSRFAARVAARHDTVVPAGATPEFLASWPVRVLGDPDLADLLVRLGLRTLDAFAALPPASVLARFGPGGARAHRLARGLDLHPPVLGPSPPELVETHEFEPPAERVDVATFVAKTMADHLLTALASRGLACTQVLVEAQTEHGEVISRCWRHDRALTPSALAERVRWQLEGWLAASEGNIDPELLAADAVTGGLTRLRLVPEEVVPAVGRQLGFWGGDAAAADRAARTFARVQGLLGPDAVVAPVVQGGRTPAEQIRWVPWGEPREPLHTREPGPWPGAVPSPAPARVLDPPAPAELLDRDGAAVVVSGRGDTSGVPGEVRSVALPGGGGAVVAWAGPWLHDVRWWDPVEQRRHARWQLVVRAGGVDIACLLALERGRAVLEALYD
jgi:protein ImuB